MEHSARDADWAELENGIKSMLSPRVARKEDLDWAVMIFAVAFGKNLPISELDKQVAASHIREQIEESFEKDEFIIQLMLRRLDDDSVFECWRATATWLKPLDKAEIRDFSIYLIDKLISISAGYEVEASRVPALMVKGIFNRRGESELVDVLPSTGELFVAAQELSYVLPYIARRRAGNDTLLKLKLRIHHISYKEVGTDEISHALSNRAVCVLDLNANSSEGLISQAPTIDPSSTLKEFIRLGIKNRCAIITPLLKDKNFRQGRKLLKLASEHLPINAVIRFSAPERNSASHALMIITTDGRSNDADRDVLHVDVTTSNKAIQDLNYLEAANLAISLYNIWSDSGWASSYTLKSVQRILNAQFEHGYRSIPELCGVFRWPRKERLELQLLSPPHDLAKKNYQPSLLINGKPILASLIDSQSNKCIYVIGNNGEGKSFLLRDLVHLLVEENKKCVALSVSPADRFPSQMEGLGEHYSRLGESNSKSKRSDSTTQALLGMVGKFDRRFDVFTDVMAMLGFNQNIYLVRKNNKEKQDINSKLVIPLRFFSSRAHADPDDASKIDSTKYEVGIVPRDENNIIPFSRLSSGERNVIQLVTLLIGSAAPEVTFFVDEPEISLHVKWQQILPRVFSNIAGEFGLSLVVATHSPVVIANTGFDNSACYIAQAGILEAIDSSNRHSVETILLQGFQTYTPHNREVHEKCAKLVSNVIGLINTDKAKTEAAGAKAIDELESITEIIHKTSQQNGDAQECGDLDLLEKAIAAIRSVIPIDQVPG